MQLASVQKDHFEAIFNFEIGSPWSVLGRTLQQSIKYGLSVTKPAFGVSVAKGLAIIVSLCYANLATLYCAAR